MKTYIFKPLILSSLFALSMLSGESMAQSPTTLNMESGNKTIDAPNC